MKKIKHKYYFISGEASGDLHGSNLLREISKLDNTAEFRGWGGDKMEAEGMHLVKHFRETSFMGFWEIIKNLGVILRLFRLAKKDILEFQPEAVILIDYPGFNLRMAKWLHGQGIKVIYYISPQVWAWKANRVFDIKKYVDLMITILPFEKDFYNQHHYQVHYIGHPLLDEIAKYQTPQKSASQAIIAILPGSRKQEIEKMLVPMVRAAQSIKTHQIIIAAPAAIKEEFYKQILKNAQISEDHYTILKNKTYELLQKSALALVSSGTATLEAALWEVPQVVCYRGSRFSFWIAKMLVRLPFISLVNLIANEKVVIELIQNDFNHKNIIAALEWTHQNREMIIRKYQKIKKMLGEKGASKEAAQLIWQNIHKKENHKSENIS